MDLQKYRLPEDFPKELYALGYPLDEDFGFNEIVWNAVDIVKVIDFLCNRNYAILGGDVYQKIAGKFKLTYDNWYLNKENLSWDQYVTASKSKAILYINFYRDRNGDSFCYGVVFCDKDRYAELK